MSIKSKFSPLGYLFPKTPQVELTIRCNVSVDDIYLNGVSVAQNTDEVTISVNEGLKCDIYAVKDGYNDSPHQNFIIYANKSINLTLSISDLETLYLTINSGSDGKFIIPFNQYRQVQYNWKIDWGDGTDWHTYSGTGQYNTGIEYNNYQTNHNYTIKIKNNGSSTGWLQAFGFDVTITDTDASPSSLHNKNKLLVVDGQLSESMFCDVNGRLPDYSFAYMFQDCKNLQVGESFNFFNCRTIGNYVFQFMFQNCSSLSNLRNMTLDFSNITNIDNNFCYGMFQNCSSLSSLGDFNLPQNNISHIGEYFCYGMFQNCSSLSSLGDLTTTNSANYSNYAFAYMFKDCTALNDLSNFNFPQRLQNAPQIGFAYRMFHNCITLESLGNMKIPNITAINNNTYSVIDRQSIIFIPYDNLPVKISYFEETFCNCISLKTGIVSFLSNWSNATQVMVDYHWIYTANVLQTRRVPVLYRVFRQMFKNCSAIQETLTPAIPVLSFVPTLNPIGYNSTFDVITETRQTFADCPSSLIATISDNWK